MAESQHYCEAALPVMRKSSLKHLDEGSFLEESADYDRAAVYLLEPAPTHRA